LKGCKLERRARKIVDALLKRLTGQVSSGHSEDSNRTLNTLLAFVGRR